MVKIKLQSEEKKGVGNNMFISSRYYYSKIYDLHSYHIVAQETFNRRHFAFFFGVFKNPI